MAWLIPSIMATLAGTAILVFCYYYLFLRDPKKYLKIWSISWAIYFFRYVFMLAFLVWMKNPFFLICNQLSSLISGILLLYGSYLFIDRKFPRIFFYLSLMGAIWVIFAILYDLTFLVTSLPTFSFLATIYIWTGYIFLKHYRYAQKEAKIVGWAFIIWGIHKANYPFLRPVIWFAPWGYLLGALLEFISALGLILVYFRKTKNELLDNQNRLLEAQKTAKIGDWSWQLEKNLLVWSDETYRIFGQSPETFKVTVESFEKAIHPDDYQKFLAERDAALKENRAVNIEHRIVLPDNRIRWVHEISSVIKNEMGDIVKVTGTVQDITQRKKSEEALLESQERFTLAMEASQDGLFDWNLVTSEIYYSPGWKRLLGYKDNEIKNDFSEWERLTKPEHVEESWTMLNDVLTGKRERFKNEFQMLHKNGHWIDILARANVIFDKNGRGIRVVGTHVDITARKASERALKESEKRHRSIIETAMDGFWLTDCQGRLREVNATYQRMSGYSEEELILLHIFDLNCLESSDDVIRRFENIMLKGEDRFESRHRRKDGSLFDVEVSVQYRPEQRGQFICFIRDITDIKKSQTEREKLQAQLLQAQKMESVGRLAGGVAHDFNNMLGVILGHVEFALEKTEDNQSLYADLKEIQKAARRSADLTKQLLTFARKQIIEPKVLDLNNTIESMLKMLRRLIGEDIDLSWLPAKQLWPVKIDPSQVDQILANLCVNARDAISGVGQLDIETLITTLDQNFCAAHAGCIPGDYVMLAVSDNGCGMDRETLKNLFEPFFTTKDIGEGTGLGLATVYGIVKQNNGFINVYSEPGQGATFKIYLPRFYAGEDTDKSVHQKKTVAKGTETILLVEDEASILKMTRIMLESKGYTILSAATPSEAMEKAKNHSGTIDLLMTDVVMPEMNGRDLAGQITAIYPGIRLFFMSGYTANIIAHQGVLDDGVAFIQKPFSVADLTEKVREILDKA